MIELLYAMHGTMCDLETYAFETSTIPNWVQAAVIFTFLLLLFCLHRSVEVTVSVVDKMYFYDNRIHFRIDSTANGFDKEGKVDENTVIYHYWNLPFSVSGSTIPERQIECIVIQRKHVAALELFNVVLKPNQTQFQNIYAVKELASASFIRSKTLENEEIGLRIDTELGRELIALAGSAGLKASRSQHEMLIFTQPK